MSDSRTFKQRRLLVMRLWAKKDFDAAMVEVERMQKTWPGNGQLRILWACLVQLQENPTHSLDDAKRALQDGN